MHVSTYLVYISRIPVYDASHPLLITSYDFSSPLYLNRDVDKFLLCKVLELN